MRWLLLVLILIVSPSVRAAEAERIVVVAPDVDAEVRARLRAELMALGFEVVERELAGSLEDTARSQDAAFALAVAVHQGGYEVSLRDRVTQKTLFREVVGAADPGESALRVVELLRASLLELRARHRVAGEVAQTPRLTRIAEQTLKADAPKTKHAPPRAPEPTGVERFGRDLTSPDLTARASVELGGNLLFDGGGSGAGHGLEVAGGWFMPRYLQTRLFARYQFLPSSLEVPEGRVQFRAAQLGVSAALHFVDPIAPVSPFVELGGVFTWLHVEGQTTFRVLKAREVDAFAVVPFVAPGITAGSEAWRGRVTLGIGIPIPSIHVLVRDSIVESWGRPLFFASYGVQYQFR